MGIPQESDYNSAHSFRNEFKFSWSQPPQEWREATSYGEQGKFVNKLKPGPSALDTRHPFYSVLSRQADGAVPVVKLIEDYLNLPQRFVLPTRISCGAIGKTSERAIGVARVKDKWRIVVYSWNWHPVVTSFSGYEPRPSRQRRKPWLECGMLDKILTIEFIPKLLDAMLEQVQELAQRVAQNDRTLDRVIAALKTIPG